MDQILFSEKIPGLFMERVRRDSGFDMPQVHFHSSYEIYFLLEGERSYFMENRTYHIRPGGLAFISQNRIHKTSAIRSARHERVLIEIEPQLMRRITGLFSDFPVQSFFAVDYGALDLTQEESAFVKGLLLRMAGEIREKPPEFEECVCLILGELLIFIFRKAGSAPDGYSALNSEKHRKVYEIAGYISEKYQEIASVDQISRQFFVNKCYLCHIFRDVTGLTVSEYLNDCRIMAAKKLLTETSDSISQIASAVGYDSMTYFDRVFRKHIGQSPIRYRKMYSEPETVFP